MTVTEAHDKLNKWFPNRSHSINLHYWQHVSQGKPQVTTSEIQFMLSVHNPHAQEFGSTLRGALAKLKPTKPIPKSQQLPVADDTITEMISLVR